MFVVVVIMLMQQDAFSLVPDTTRRDRVNAIKASWATSDPRIRDRANVRYVWIYLFVIFMHSAICYPLRC